MRGTKRIVLCACGDKKQRYSLSCNKCAAKRRGPVMSRLTHGHSSGRHTTAEYTAYQAMKQRCCNKKNPQFCDYGARGISVCKRWLASFEVFLADVGPRPSPEHSIDRINNNGHYEPRNVRWATSAEQGRNKRSSLRLRDLKNRPLTLQECAYKLAMSYSQCRSAFVHAGIIPRRPSDPKSRFYARPAST